MQALIDEIYALGIGKEWTNNEKALAKVCEENFDEIVDMRKHCAKLFRLAAVVLMESKIGEFKRNSQYLFVNQISVRKPDFKNKFVIMATTQLEEYLTSFLELSPVIEGIDEGLDLFGEGENRVKKTFEKKVSLLLGYLRNQNSFDAFRYGKKMMGISDKDPVALVSSAMEHWKVVTEEDELFKNNSFSPFLLEGENFETFKSIQTLISKWQEWTLEFFLLRVYHSKLPGQIVTKRKFYADVGEESGDNYVDLFRHIACVLNGEIIKDTKEEDPVKRKEPQSGQKSKRPKENEESTSVQQN